MSASGTKAGRPCHWTHVLQRQSTPLNRDISPGNISQLVRVCIFEHLNCQSDTLIENIETCLLELLYITLQKTIGHSLLNTKENISGSSSYILITK